MPTADPQGCSSYGHNVKYVFLDWTWSVGHLYLVRVVGGGPASIDSVRGHDRPQVVPLHQEFVLVLSTLFVDVNDGSGDLGNSLDHHLPITTRRFTNERPCYVLNGRVTF